MIIDLRTLSDGPRRYDFFLEEDWWASKTENDSILSLDSPLQVEIEVDRAGDKYILEGGLWGGLQVRCDRCLAAYHWELRSGFRVFLALPSTEADREEVELLEEDLEVDFIKGEEIELDEIVREQIYLSLPMKSVCSESCLGLCPICGTNLNREKCHCRREQGHPGFLKLKNLKMQGE
jgi:uncharacterized protein